MELIYRGIKYKTSKLVVSNSAKKKQIIYLKQSIKPIGKLRFPVFKYCKQLFCSGKVAVTHPFKFWYRHKSQHLKNCWQIDIVDRLNSSWKTTLYIEQNQTLPNRPPIELKYRGVTYYR